MRIVALIVVSLLTSSARSAETPTRLRLLVAATSVKDVDPTVVELVRNELIARIGRMPEYAAVTPEEVRALVDLEAQKQELRCADENSCLAELGEAAGADRVLASTLGRIGGSTILGLTLIEPQSSQVLGRATATGERTGDLVGALDTAVLEVFGLRGKQRIEKFSLRVPPGGIKAAAMPLAAQGVAADLGQSLTQVVTTELKKLDGFSVVSQDDIAAMLSFESGKQQLGCDDSACLAEIGGALGVDYLLIGNVGRIEDTFLVGLKLINVRKGEVINRVNETFKGRESDLIPAARFAVYQLVGHEPKTPGRISLKLNTDDAAILLNGEPMDDAARLETLLPGRHALRIDADGYYSRYVETYVEPGARTDLLIELEEIPVPLYRRWWVWTAAAVLVVGGVASVYLYSNSNPPPETGAVELEIVRGLRASP